MKTNIKPRHVFLLFAGIGLIGSSFYIMIPALKRRKLQNFETEVMNLIKTKNKDLNNKND